MIPGIDSILYGRRVIEAAVERYEHMATAAANAGNHDRADRHRGRAAVMRRELLGLGGCVVAPFDERWLDPDFRAQMTRARASALATRGAHNMSKNPSRQNREERDNANRSARTWRTWGHQKDQAGEDSSIHNKAADEAAARAVAAQRRIDKAEGEPK